MSYKIGIVGWNLGENSFGATKSYMEYLGYFGQVVILAPHQGIMEDLDLVVLPGGKDISSFIYGKVPSYYNSDPDLMKEFFFHNNLRQYVEAGVPIFGICLGMQQLNVYFGGRMLQNVGLHEYSTDSRSELVHELAFSEPYNGRFGKVSVNSLHHQAVDPDKIPDCLEVVATSKHKGKKDEAIEIIKHRELPIWGVQYHPEEIYDPVASKIIKHLLSYERVQKADRTREINQEPA